MNAANGIFYMDLAGNLVYKGVLNVKSATSGQRMEITNSSIKIYDSAGTLRVNQGDLS